MVERVQMLLPPTELWLEQPATVRERTGSGSLKGMAAGMQTQTVLLAPPSTPRMTLPMRGLWHSSTSHMSRPVYRCISPSLPEHSLAYTLERKEKGTLEKEEEEEESSPARPPTALLVCSLGEPLLHIYVRIRSPWMSSRGERDGEED